MRRMKARCWATWAMIGFGTLLVLGAFFSPETKAHAGLTTSPSACAPGGVCKPPPPPTRALALGGLTTSPSWEAWLAIGGAAWTLLSLIVKATPTTADDAWLARIVQRVSFLRPPNVPDGLLPGPLARLSLPGTRPRPNGEGV